jgi:hypothetical protein
MQDNPDFTVAAFMTDRKLISTTASQSRVSCGRSPKVLAWHNFTKHKVYCKTQRHWWVWGLRIIYIIYEERNIVKERERDCCSVDWDSYNTFKIFVDGFSMRRKENMLDQQPNKAQILHWHGAQQEPWKWRSVDTLLLSVVVPHLCVPTILISLPCYFRFTISFSLCVF